MPCLIFFTIFAIFGYFTLVSTSSSSDLDPKYGQVVFSSVLFRHGQRTPAVIYPLDPYNASFYPQGLLQLTNAGRMEMYQTGQWFRQWYSDLLNKGYNSDTLYMVSSDRDRTIMSAECFLAGMLPPNKAEIWNPNLLWQPIPVHSISAQVDNIIAITRACPKLNYLLEELNTEPWFIEFFEERKPLWKYLNEHTGMSFTVDDISASLMKSTFILDTLNIQESYNISLPNWFTPDIMAQVGTVAATVFSANYTSTELIRLKMGVMLGTMGNDMISKKNGDLQPDYTFKFYSGREENIFGLMIALGTFNMNTDYQNASVIIELRKHNDDYNVLVLLQDNGETPTVLEMPTCPLPCSLDKFYEAIEKYVPSNWDEECAMSSNISTWTYGLIIGILLLFIVVALLALYYGKRVYNNFRGTYEKL